MSGQERPPAIPMGQVSSRVPDGRFRASARRDVFWSGDWVDRKDPVQWLAPRAMELEAQYAGEEHAFFPDGSMLDRAGGRRIVSSDPLRFERVALLGAVDQWRTMTAEQASAVAGVPLRTVVEARVLPALASAGLVEWGISSRELRGRGRRKEHVPFMRPSATGAFERLVAPRLTYGELVAVTGGLPFSDGRQFTRHNVLATELGLRAAEFLPGVAAVLGEKLSRLEMLFPFQGGSETAGDLVLVRDDGLRIVVELTATSPADSFKRKVLRWARILSRFPLATSGVVVLFVEASRPSDRPVVRQTMRLMRRHISSAVAGFPGVPGESAADRMLVASWQDFFPAAHSVSEEFLRLAVHAPTGPQVERERWRPCALLGEGRVALTASPGRAEELRSVVAAAQMLAGSPFWMRSAGDVGVWHAMLDMAGVGVIPVRSSLTMARDGEGRWRAGAAGGKDLRVLQGLGRESMPRAASRGLPVVPPGLRVRGGAPWASGESFPVFEGFSFARERLALRGRARLGRGVGGVPVDAWGLPEDQPVDEWGLPDEEGQ